MRFGKSFTAMCCAKETDAKFVVVVSAKADVKEEWKKTVESHVDFAGYKFLDSDALNRNETVIAETLATADKVEISPNYEKFKIVGNAVSRVYSDKEIK